MTSANGNGNGFAATQWLNKIKGTVADEFKSLGLFPWWQQQPTQSFGVNGELGADFAAKANTPIGAITGGRVVNVFHSGPAGSSIGYIVQVQDEGGGLWHYQHLRNARVAVGQTISPGDVVGTSGGCMEGAYGSDGNSCSAFDPWSTGPHIEVRYSPTFRGNTNDWHTAGDQQWRNPLPAIQAAALASPLGGLNPIIQQLYAGQNGGTQGSFNPTPLSTQGGSSSSGGAHDLHIPAIFPGGSAVDINLDPAIDFSVRALLILIGIALVLVGIFLVTRPDKKLEAVAPELAAVA